MTVALELADLCRLVGRLLGAQAVAPDDRFIEDLGAESIDLVNVVAEVEERCQVTIAEELLGSVASVRDLHRVLIDEA